MAARRRRAKRRAEVTPEQEAWLAGDDNGAGQFHFVSEGDHATLWAEHGERVVSDYVEQYPGTRPRRWWQYEAPRSPIGTYPSRYYDGKLSEPRKRLGGVGTPMHECLSCVPCFEYGLPVIWLTQDLASLYRGTAKDIHGEPIFPEYFSRPFDGVAIDENDPPQYESQAAYLKRHGLFLIGEAKRLSKRDFEQETIK